MESSICTYCYSEILHTSAALVHIGVWYSKEKIYIAATEKLSESEKHEIEMDIKNAEIYLRNSETEKHRKITTTQPEYFDGIRTTLGSGTQK